MFTDRVQCPFLTRFFTEIGRTNMCAIWRIAKIWECPFMPCRREPPSSGPQYHFPRRRWTQRSPSKPSEPSHRRPFRGSPNGATPCRYALQLWLHVWRPSLPYRPLSPTLLLIDPLSMTRACALGQPTSTRPRHLPTSDNTTTQSLT